MRPSSHSTRWNGRKLARLRKASLNSPTWPKTECKMSIPLSLSAENVAGHGDQMSGGEVLLGTPYEMPFDEDFENGSDNFKYTPWVKYQPENDYSANWWVWPTENVIPSGTGNCLVGKPKEANTRGLMGMPAFAAGTEEGHLELSIDAFINANTPDLTITGLCEGIDNEVEIGRISKGDNDVMKTLIFIFPQEFTKASWVQLFFNVYYPVHHQSARR